MFFTIFIILFLIWLLYIVESASDSDPVKKCPVYKNEGCSYVDGPFCNMENCVALKNYKETHATTDNDTLE